MKKPLDLSGLLYGRLTAVERIGSAWMCRCACGGSKVVETKQLRSGKTASCGCLFRDVMDARNRTHGLSDDPAYRCWKDMRSRCNTPTDSDYKDYGGRGIKVCERWSQFPNFLADMGPRPEGTSLDRIDVNGDYEPSNCRWATPKEQARNKRSNRMIEWRGRKQPLSAWCEEVGIEHSKARYRLQKGWTLDSVFSLEDFRK